MTTKTNGNQFRDDEILILEQVRDGEPVKNIFPKIGGRLRLAHEDNEQLSICTEIVRYDEVIAVVKSVVTTMKGSFPGFGMASTERDHSIAPAILELAETRAIARSLRFAGYGVEYCSAEEVSHLNGGLKPSPDTKTQTKPPQDGPKGGNGERPQNGGNGGNGSEKSGGNGGNGDARVSNKQLNYIVTLGRDLKLNSKDLDKETVQVFGVKMAYLTTKQASSFIDTLKERSA
ncbi:MAG: hypothetical protein CVU57_06345 [Deltaproteobacteria bacterium HGW-Deltaproteobacteria-15]|jgi:hypothetical protein|nr:MAG: hypothetical protein CVU57_06345 [Deltaproteobacteria bacterium HGW-Deltaproteobacteria-15]